MHKIIRDKDKTKHVSCTITGSDADKFSIIDLLDNLSQDLNFEITSLNENIYYTEPKEIKK